MMLKTFGWYILAAFAEIAGCFEWHSDFCKRFRSRGL
jgi:drug/metabolite transporter superfamily protein YnfA